MTNNNMYLNPTPDKSILDKIKSNQMCPMYKLLFKTSVNDFLGVLTTKIEVQKLRMQSIY